MKYMDPGKMGQRINRRVVQDQIIKTFSLLATLFGIVILFILLYQIFSEGFAVLNVHFLTSKLSTIPEQAGILGALLGTFWLIVVVTPITLFLGVTTAIFTELYMGNSKFKKMLTTNIANLAGVPSIVYGILGLTIFVRALELGNIVLAGGLTISLLILPITIVASQEAIRAVPNDLSEGALGLGATKWQTIYTVILPAALPSILTGIILAISRAIGETAPLVVIGIPTLLLPLPGSIFDKFTILPMQIYYWTVDSVLVAEYANLAAATIIVLLFVLSLFNLVAVLIRKKYQYKF